MAPGRPDPWHLCCKLQSGNSAEKRFATLAFARDTHLNFFYLHQGISAAAAVTAAAAAAASLCSSSTPTSTSTRLMKENVLAPAELWRDFICDRGLPLRLNQDKSARPRKPSQSCTGGHSRPMAVAPHFPPPTCIDPLLHTPYPCLLSPELQSCRAPRPTPKCLSLLSLTPICA